MNGLKLQARMPARIALLAALVTGGSALAVDWVELGPAPISNGQYTGRVSAVACSPTSPNKYFVAGADGGVWRTTNGGASWTPVTEHLPTLAMGALAIDPTNENVIYAGSGEANYANHSRYGLGLYKSIDGGDTWTVLAVNDFAGRCFSRIVINPLAPEILYAAIARAGGFPGGTLPAAKGHPGRNGPVGVFRSVDGGATWIQLTNGLPNEAATDLVIHPTNVNVLYAAIGHPFGASTNGVYKTTDAGASWTKLAGGLPTASVGRISLDIAPSMPSRVYVLISRACDANGGNGGTLSAWRTDNDGASWTALPIRSCQSSYGWYLSFVSVNPADANMVFMGGLNIERSLNAGASWNTVNPLHVDMHGFDWDAAGRPVIGQDGGVNISTSAPPGSSWTSINNNLGVIQFYAGLSTHPTDANIVLGGMQDNGTALRNSATTQWLQGLDGDGGWTQIDQANPLRAFAEMQQSGNLYMATDGGLNFWQYAGSGISSGDRNCFLPPYLIDPTNSNRMLYATHRIYQSLSGGSSWTPISVDITGGTGAVRALAMAPSDPQVVYAATNDGRVLRSDNGGANFTLLLTGNPGWPRVTRELFVHPTQPLTVYLAGAHFGVPHVRRSTDGGQTWTTLDGDLPDVPVNVVVVDVRGRFPVLYAGADDGVYRSIFDGASWHRYGANLPHACVIDLRLDPARRRLIAGTQGRGAWRVPIAIPGDMNDDGRVDFDDINPFVLALTDPAAYRVLYPQLDPNLSGDTTGDEVLNFDDINGFVALLGG
ncbi:MAG: hypothetical protein AB1716_05735 [Planctomycetota bacterium]